MCASARSRLPMGEIMSCSRRCSRSVGCASEAPDHSSWSSSPPPEAGASWGTTTSSLLLAEPARGAVGGCASPVGASAFSSRNGLDESLIHFLGKLERRHLQQAQLL